MIRKRRVIPFVIATALSLSACGNEAKDTSVTPDSSATTEKSQGSDAGATERQKKEETGKIHQFVPRETTNYIYYNGEKIDIIGNAIAENVFNGYYGVSERDPKKKYQFPETASLRETLPYTLEYDGNKKPLSSLPVGVVFGRGCRDFGNDILFDRGLTTTLSGSSLGQNSSDGHIKEEECHQQFIEKFGAEEGEEIYLKYLTVNHMFHAELIFLAEGETKTQEIECLYTVDGDTIHFQEIALGENYDVLEKNFVYEMKYRFNGFNLILSGGDTELVYEPGERLQGNEDDPRKIVSGVPYGIDGSIDSLVYLSQTILHYDTSDSLETNTIFFGNNTKGKNETVRFEDDGTFLLQGEVHPMKEPKPEILGSFDIRGEYIAYGNLSGGVTLIVDHKAYPYTNSHDEYKGLLTAGIVTNDVDPEEDEEAAAEIADKKEKAVERVSGVVDDSLGVLIDAVSGEATVNSGILFDFDSAELKDEGRQVLDEFMKAYAPVIMELKKENLITGIQISGYTDSKGGYEYNLDLSQKRADTVRSYLLEKYPELDGVMTAKGLASKDLIINADGTVDDEKSRRVAFQMAFSSEQ